VLGGKFGDKRCWRWPTFDSRRGAWTRLGSRACLGAMPGQSREILRSLRPRVVGAPSSFRPADAATAQLGRLGPERQPRGSAMIRVPRSPKAPCSVESRGHDPEHWMVRSDSAEFRFW